MTQQYFKRTFWNLTDGTARPIESLLFCRDVDGAIVRPLPRAKRMLSEATCLPHIVQVKIFRFTFQVADKSLLCMYNPH